jgi:hypothetical protein
MTVRRRSRVRTHLLNELGEYSGSGHSAKWERKYWAKFQKLASELYDLERGIRARTRNDMAWHFYDKDLEEVRYVADNEHRPNYSMLVRGTYHLRKAVQMIEGALSRLPSSTPW